MEGNISQGVAGADGIVNQISSAHQNEGTKAIVLRVNSGGGSVIASEMMRDELIEAKRKGIDDCRSKQRGRWNRHELQHGNVNAERALQPGN